MEINLYPYQQESFDLTIAEFNKPNVKKVCTVLPTGGGKSVLIAKLAQTLPGRTLILTHRIEILTQNAEWLPNSDVLTSKTKQLNPEANIVIAMVQTTFARIQKYGTDYLGHFDNIILDEVQILIFQKVFEKYDFKKIVGLTATPILNKRRTLIIDDEEYTQDVTLSETFDTLVQTVDTQDIIEMGKLVQDYNIVLEVPGFENLKESFSQPDGYTTKSLNDVYSNKASLETLSKAYNKHCKGKKTMIFNATTKVNGQVCDHFKKMGLNAKQFDSVNTAEINPKTKKPYNRKEIVQWFKDTPGAILINVNVFTTGFNVTDVQCVIVNRATKSLSLWLQMVGRGSRTTKKILKDFFTVIDLGQNIHEHGIWSERRNWMKHFYPAPPKRKRKMDMIQTWDCTGCGGLNVVGELYCSECGLEKQSFTEQNEGRAKTGELVVLSKMPLPTSKSIINYTLDNNESSNFAYKVLTDRILQLFKHYNISADEYSAKEERFNSRIEQIVRPIYFAIMKSDLEGSNKRLKTFVSQVQEKVRVFYYPKPKQSDYKYGLD